MNIAQVPSSHQQRQGRLRSVPKRENPFVNMLTAIQREYSLSSSSDRDILCCSLTVTVIINS